MRPKECGPFSPLVQILWGHGPPSPYTPAHCEPEECPLSIVYPLPLCEPEDCIPPPPPFANLRYVGRN